MHAPPATSDTFGCPWTPEQQQMVWAITSVYENNTTVVQYPYCENIADGRGYTSGRAGFCSGTGDAEQVVDCFAKAVARQPGLGAHDLMGKYLAGLKGLKGADTAPVDRLGPYCRDWETTAADAVTGPLFKACQDHVAMTLYQTPACRAASAWGVTSPLFLGELYDAWVNHGEADDLLAAAAADVGVKRSGTRLSSSDESAFLHAFLTRRLDVLRKDSTWTLAVDRLAPYEAARRAGNFDFSAPVDTSVKSATLWPNLHLADSQAPACKLALVGTGAQRMLEVTGEAACTTQTIPSSLPGHPPTVH